jgi:hypothetical protein
MTTLQVGGVPVATYVEEPDLDIRLSPRPYLHPVRTLAGTTVTDALCYDHPWHLGASLTMSDVAGHNLWGGRTYVRDQGYVWLEDHGRIRHRSSSPIPGGLTESLTWCTSSDEVLLREQREITATAAPHGWELSFAYALTAPGPAEVTLGSPATHGRPGNAGYGGFFWRATPGPAVAFTESPADPHGSADPWLALVVADRYTLVFSGLAGDDRWFVRTDDYVGVCAALAFTDPLPVKPDEPLSRHVRVLVADGALSRTQIAESISSRAPLT